MFVYKTKTIALLSFLISTMLLLNFEFANANNHLFRSGLNLSQRGTTRFQGIDWEVGFLAAQKILITANLGTTSFNKKKLTGDFEDYKMSGRNYSIAVNFLLEKKPHEYSPKFRAGMLLGFSVSGFKTTESFQRVFHGPNFGNVKFPYGQKINHSFLSYDLGFNFYYEHVYLTGKMKFMQTLSNETTPLTTSGRYPTHNVPGMLLASRDEQLWLGFTLTLGYTFNLGNFTTNEN